MKRPRRRAAVMAPAKFIGTPNLQRWIKRGGPGHSNSGPRGRKMRPAAVRYRALAEMAGMYRNRRKK